MKKILIILFIFGIDRLSKMYLINLQSMGTDIDFYVFPFLNFYLVWNTGIGFGLASLEASTFYHIITLIIILINLLLVFLLISQAVLHYSMIHIIEMAVYHILKIHYYILMDTYKVLLICHIVLYNHYILCHIVQ